jgi:hypothetical protein
MATMYQGSERMRPTATICCLYKSPADVIRTLLQFDSYRPELHYMRGPGPKWYAKHELAFASLYGAARYNERRCRAWREQRGEAQCQPLRCGLARCGPVCFIFAVYRNLVNCILVFISECRSPSERVRCRF